MSRALLNSISRFTTVSRAILHPNLKFRIPVTQQIHLRYHGNHATNSEKKPFQIPNRIPGIKNIITVASGKGGVGKSTIAVNLAVSLARLIAKNHPDPSCSIRVGLLDVDVYGPSVHRMMGLRGKPEIIDVEVENQNNSRQLGPEESKQCADDGQTPHKPIAVEKKAKLKPMEAAGVKVMSMGLLLPQADENDKDDSQDGTIIKKGDEALVWRGPMVASAIHQLLHDVHWGEIDILVIDMPPGTGDAQITVTQKVPVTGAVIVSTPQDIALIDARRAVTMFRTVMVPILGIVENMSYYACTKCGHHEPVFGDGGVDRTAKSMNLDFIGKIPLHTMIREACDAGNPVSSFNNPQASSQGEAFTDIAQKVYDKILKIEMFRNATNTNETEFYVE